MWSVLVWGENDFDWLPLAWSVYVWGAHDGGFVGVVVACIRARTTTVGLCLKDFHLRGAPTIDVGMCWYGLCAYWGANDNEWCVVRCVCLSGAQTMTSGVCVDGSCLDRAQNDEGWSMF